MVSKNDFLCVNCNLCFLVYNPKDNLYLGLKAVSEAIHTVGCCWSIHRERNIACEHDYNYERLCVYVMDHFDSVSKRFPGGMP